MINGYQLTKAGEKPKYPLCINCKHCLTDPAKYGEYPRCALISKTNLVTGEAEFAYCDHIRDYTLSSAFSSYCGAAGDAFEQKEPEVVKSTIEVVQKPNGPIGYLYQKFLSLHAVN